MAKKSISWSATANKEWVTLEPTEGFGDSNMKVIVQPAESQDDDLEATITITYGNGKVVNRTVSRCERKPLSNDYSLSFTVSGSYDACFTGQVSITDIKGITVTKLDNGTQTEKTESLSLDDIGVSYIIGGNTLDSMEKNMSTLPRTVKVVGTWNGASYEASITQSAMVVTSSGYSETSVSYSNLYFPSSNPTIAPSCSAGTAAFKLMGDKIEKNDTVTAETSCGDIVTLDGSSSEVVTRNVDISSIATFSLCDSAQHNMGEFNGNVLSYESNETDANISLKVCGKVGSNTVSTTYVLPKGSCGKTYYVHIFFDKATVPYKGTQSEMTAKLTYFASLSSDPTDISTAFTDGVELITKSSDRYTIGEPVVEDYVLRCDVLFKDYMEEKGRYYNFQARYEGITATASIYQSSQYENIIPAADYFVFTYGWTDYDGTDLDSATMITSPAIAGLSYEAVGYSYANYVGTVKKPYIKHGGDNIKSGAEGAIICFKNIINSFNTIGMEDTIECKIYANWYLKRLNGNMSIQCAAYKGTEKGTFNEEIYKDGFIFEPVEGKCVQVWPENGTEKFTLSVKASGAYFNPYAPEQCLDNIYSHVATLIHHVGTKQTSLVLRQGVDNGYVSRNATLSWWCDGKRLTNIYGNTAEATYDYKNVTLKYVNTDEGEDRTISFFSNSANALKLKFYEYDPISSGEEKLILPNVTYVSSDFENDWIDRLIITTHENGSFDLYLKVKANNLNRKRSIDFMFSPVTNFLPRCLNRVYNNYAVLSVYQQ